MKGTAILVNGFIALYLWYEPTPDNSAPAKSPLQKGQSGNPAGRPRGLRTTRVLDGVSLADLQQAREPIRRWQQGKQSTLDTPRRRGLLRLCRRIGVREGRQDQTQRGSVSPRPGRGARSVCPSHTTTTCI